MAVSCDAPAWDIAPVIVGGSGGSGTRGTAMLLDRLGVQMACTSSPALVDRSLCSMRSSCNDADDCSLGNSFIARLSWVRDNFTVFGRLPSNEEACDGVVDRELLSESLNTSRDDLCGGSRAAALSLLRTAVYPDYRRPLRWGFKNPHTTYFVNVWMRNLFPCAVFVNTVRDVDELTRERKHFDHRVREAARFGMINEDVADMLSRDNKMAWRRTSATTQSQLMEHAPLLRRVNDFYSTFVRTVNVRLAMWAHFCVSAQRVVHVPLQRVVALASRSPACLEAVAHSLAGALRLDRAFVLNVTAHFAASSLSLVQKSLAEGHKLAPDLFVSSSVDVGWPRDSPLHPRACEGQLLYNSSPG